MSDRFLDSLEWPEVLEEREPENDVERLSDALGNMVKTRFDGEFEGELKPGVRLCLFLSDLEIEADAQGFGVLLVRGVPVCRLPVPSYKHIHTFTDAQTREIHAVAVNGSIVWTRR